VTGSVDEEQLLRNEYLVAENRILREQIKGRWKLSDGERRTPAATDSFTTEVWTKNGLVTYYVLFFITSGYEKSLRRGTDAASERCVDDPDRSQRHDGR